MKRLIILSVSTLLFAACAEDIANSENSGKAIVFSVGDVFSADVSDVTRTATLVNSLNPSTFEFGVSEFTSSGTAVDGMQNLRLLNTHYVPANSWYNSGVAWDAAAYAISLPTFQFCAYSPYLSATTNGLTLSADRKSIRYDADGVSVANQQDLMTACASSAYTRSAIPLTFGHRLCAIQIKLGTWPAGFKITSIKFKSIVSSGSVSLLNGSWTPDAAEEYTVSGVTEADAENEDAAIYLMMIPQTVNTYMTVTLTDADSQTKNLTSVITGTWIAGKKYIYTITPQGIVTMTATYPTNWGGTAGPITQYDENENFGLFAVNASNGMIVVSNLQVQSQSAATSSTLGLPSSLVYSDQLRYFLYYPYKSNLTTTYPAMSVGRTNTSTTAAEFFSTVISGWTPVTDQSSEAVFKGQDLQVGMLSSNNFAMTHAMGLIKVNMPTAVSVPELALFTVNRSNTKYTSGSVTAYGLNAFRTTNGGVVPYQNNRNIDYFIAKPGITYMFETPSVTSTGTTNWYTKNTSAAANSISEITTENTPIAKDIAWQWVCDETTNAETGVKSGDGHFTFSVPVSNAKYKMEVWGASGGGGTNQNQGSHRGLGGYSWGYKVIGTDISTLHVFCGGEGTFGCTYTHDGTARTSEMYGGGYNGGGNGGSFSKDAYGGGGMSHISTTNNVAVSRQSYNAGTGFTTALSNWVVFREESWNPEGTLIVAGGGGGSDNCSGGGAALGSGDDGSGGYGGGEVAGSAYIGGKIAATVTEAQAYTEDGTSTPAGTVSYANILPSTQTSGYKQGCGQTVTELLARKMSTAFSYTDAGGGGGGWWGGMTPSNPQGGGCGGSGYIGGMDSGQTIAGNQSFLNPLYITDPSTQHETETGHNGHGYARITLCGE